MKRGREKEFDSTYTKKNKQMTLKPNKLICPKIELD